MKNYILVSTALALLGQTRIIAAEAIVVDESRPLVELVTQLARKGYLVSYEEAPYDDAALVVEVRPNGLRYRYPRWRSIKFQLPDQAAPDAEPPAGMLEAFIKQYQGSGNPGQFASLSDGEYLHVIPAARISGGVAQNFEPILSTHVSFVAEVRSCNETLSDLFTKIRAVRGVSMVLGVSPIRQLILGQCVVLGQDLTAREALISDFAASRSKSVQAAGTYALQLVNDVRRKHGLLCPEYHDCSPGFVDCSLGFVGNKARANPTSGAQFPSSRL